MARLSAGRRAKMPKSSFAGPGRSFPINDPLHARLAIGGATRAERAGNISAGQAASIKAKARDKLGGANDVSHGSKSANMASHRGNKAGGPPAGNQRGGGMSGGTAQSAMGTQHVATRGGGMAENVQGKAPRAGMRDADAKRNGGGGVLKRAGGTTERGNGRQVGGEGSRTDMAQDRALAARKGIPVAQVEGTPEDMAADRRMSGRAGARDGMGSGSGGLAVHSSASGVNIGGYEPRHSSKHR